MIKHYLSPSAQVSLRQAVLEADGNEVFCLGYTDESRLVLDIEILARGNRDAVPAILQACRIGDVVIHNHPSGHLTPSSADLEIASQLGSLGVGFYIVDNAVDNLYRVVEAFEVPEQRVVKDSEVAELLGSDGSISQALVDYEDRPEQLRMAFAVNEAFNENQVSLIEAGTGTGKSLAYLVPAILWSRQNQERVVISTNTINLQEQLIRKDLPFLQRSSQLDFRFELIKGRSNYLCRRRMAAVKHEPGLFDSDQASQIDALCQWTEQTSDGSREDLAFLPEDSLWEEVCCEADQCARSQCLDFGRCFFHQARRRAAHADVLVANHALLLSDLALRQQTDNFSTVAVLPPFSRLVIDEAHHLEDVATRYFSTQVSRFAYARTLNRLQNPRKAHRGLLPRLLQKLGTALTDDQDERFRSFHEQINALLTLRQALVDRSVSTLEHCGTRLAATIDEKPQKGSDIRQRLVSQVTGHALWPEIDKDLRSLARLTDDFADALRALLKALRSLADEVYEEIRSTVTDLSGLVWRLDGLALQLRAFVVSDPSTCAWFDVSLGRIGRGEGIVTRLCTAPLDVAPLLRECLMDRKQTVVMTSATLTVAQRFDYLRGRVGLEAIEPQRLRELQLSSPFDFSQQALVAIPNDIPEPGQAGFPEAVCNLVEQAVLLADGRSFVLFTAYSLLRRVHSELEPVLTSRGYQVLRQGDATRHRLLQQFSQDPTSVLFATDSFWEGVDVPGRALEQVIMARLPFRVPTEPVLQARAEAIAAAGGDPFLNYTVPQAVIRFRQGFGRLIRHRKDRGIVLLLDSRVVKRGYGRTFLNSLPEVRVATSSSTELLSVLSQFWADAE
jgi:ATP-dependent DNA helicase DinG